jgi:hypothetical protein
MRAGLLGVIVVVLGLAPAARELPRPVEVVPWRDVAAQPCKFQGQSVTLRVQFRDLPARWQAGPTRFGPGMFVAVTAWADEQFPWVREEFTNPHVVYFVRKGTELERTFAAARTHQRFEVRGVVREVWRDRPWIELQSAVPLEGEVGEATIIHAGRALTLIEEGSFELADEALRQALAAPMPEPARAELARLRAVCAEGLTAPRPVPIRPRKK